MFDCGEIERAKEELINEASAMYSSEFQVPPLMELAARSLHNCFEGMQLKKLLAHIATIYIYGVLAIIMCIKLDNTLVNEVCSSTKSSPHTMYLHGSSRITSNNVEVNGDYSYVLYLEVVLPGSLPIQFDF